MKRRDLDQTKQRYMRLWVSQLTFFYKSTVVRYRPVSYPDGPITACYRFIKNAYWVLISGLIFDMGRAMRKRVFRYMQTAKTQISLRIRAVWSGPSLSAYRIIGHYRMNQLRAKARMRLQACAGWILSVHFAHVRRHLFSWRDLYVSGLHQASM